MISNYLLSKFKYAFSGLFYLVKYDKSFQLHSVISIIVIFAGYLLQINIFEWLLVSSAISLFLLLK